MASRINSHKIETQSRDRIRMMINNYNDCDALFRELSERDYGIDFIVELFENDLPTGKISFNQLKSTNDIIKKNKFSNDISCKNISVSCLNYSRQNKIPVILIYYSLKDNNNFYFIDLQSVVNDEIIKKARKNRNKTITIRIPLENNTNNGNLNNFFNLIDSYYRV